MEFKVFSSYYQVGSRAVSQLTAYGSSGSGSVYTPVDPDCSVIRVLGWLIVTFVETPLLRAYSGWMRFLGLD